MDNTLAGVITLLGSVIVAFLSYRAGTMKTKQESRATGRNSKRDDFTTVVDKFKEIIEYQEKQIDKQQMQIEAQTDQIDKLIKENARLKNNSAMLIREVRELKVALDQFPNIDKSLVKKIVEIHDAIVNGGE